MAHAVESRTHTPANQLRNALDEAERLIVSPSAQTVEKLLTLFDQIEQLFHDLAPMGVDLRPEEGRWQGLRNRIMSKPGPLAAAAAAAGGMKKLRNAHPPAANEWWQIDAVVAARRQHALKRFAVVTALIVGVLWLLYWGVNTFFPPSPEAILMVETNAAIDSALQQGDFAGARQAVEQSLAKAPNEPELWLWDVVLSEQLNDQARAEASLAKAKELLGGETTQFWLALGNQRMQVGNLDGAETAANAAMALSPEEPQAYFLLGGIAETRGDYPKAIELFDKTFQLAEADNPQLAVIAKVRMGNLLQRVDPFATPAVEGTPTAEPTPTP
ncbi:MAG: tetratricopeptide repeat protein [Caldilineaceae bacterium]